MLSREIVIRNKIKLEACDCTAVYMACHVTGTTIKNVVPGNSSSKLDQTGSNEKCAKQSKMLNYFVYRDWVIKPYAHPAMSWRMPSLGAQILLLVLSCSVSYLYFMATLLGDFEKSTVGLSLDSQLVLIFLYLQSNLY